MKHEDQVCSLELAKQLKELGVKQESWFYWWLCEKCKHECGCKEARIVDSLAHNIPCYSAFTVAELGEMLPCWHDSCLRAKRDWHVRVFEKDKDNICHNSLDTTEANARAKMLVYLIENDLVPMLPKETWSKDSINMDNGGVSKVSK